jgi:hypothetical protein
MLVMGATVVTTFSFFSVLTGACFSSCRPHAVKKMAKGKITKHALMTFLSFICEKRGPFALSQTEATKHQDSGA